MLTTHFMDEADLLGDRVVRDTWFTATSVTFCLPVVTLLFRFVDFAATGSAPFPIRVGCPFLLYLSPLVGLVFFTSHGLNPCIAESYPKALC